MPANNARKVKVATATTPEVPKRNGIIRLLRLLAPLVAGFLIAMLIGGVIRFFLKKPPQPEPVELVDNSGQQEKDNVLAKQAEKKTKSNLPPVNKPKDKPVEKKTDVYFPSPKDIPVEKTEEPPPDPPAPKVNLTPGILKGHSGPVWCIAFSPSGSILASGSTDKTIKLWDTKSETEIATLTGHSSQVAALAFSGDGKRIASGGTDGSIRVWDVASVPAQGRTIQESRADWTLAVAFSPIENFLATGHELGNLLIWDLEFDTSTSLDPRVYSGVVGSVRTLAYSPNGKLLAAGNEFPGRAIEFWDPAKQKVVSRFHGHKMAIYSVAFSHDGKSLASASLDDTVRVWTLKSGRTRLVLRHDDSVYAVACSRDGMLASGGQDGAVRLWNLDDGKQIRTISAHNGDVRAVAFSADGKLLASAGKDNAVRLWQVAKVAIPSPEEKAAEQRLAELIKALKSQKVDDKIKAIEELGSLGKKAAPASRALCELLLDPVQAVRVTAIDTLKIVNPTIHKLINPIFERPRAYNNSGSLIGIRDVGPVTSPVVPVLVFYKEMNANEPFFNETGLIVEALAAVAFDDPKVTKLFVTWLVTETNRKLTAAGSFGDRGNKLQITIAGSLPKMADGSKAAPALATVLQASNSPDVRTACAKALGNLGRNIPAVVTALTAAKTDSATSVREAARVALQKVEANPPDVK
jgi:WD40 repeat protein